MRYANIVAFALFIICVNCEEDVSALLDVNSLSVLPLKTLLSIKKNVLVLSGNDTDKAQTDAIAIMSKESSPEALPLLGTDYIKNKRGYFVHYEDPEDNKYEKKKSITKLFQISVTSLAFLAFGGYLLFLVITSIKGNHYSYIYNPNATQFMSALLNAQGNTKRKKKKRPIRGESNYGYLEEGFLENVKKPKVKRQITEMRNSDEMYRALLLLCEGYSKIAGVDQY